MDDELKSVFITETEDMLLEATNLLLVEDESDELLARINHVFRVVHSIKGGSQFLGLLDLAEISHHLEDLLGPLRSGKLKVDEGITTLMLDALELMETQLQYVRNGEIITAQDFEHKKKLLEKIARIHQPEVLEERTVHLNSVTRGSSAFVGKRLIYIHVQMDEESIMPQVRQFLVLERLKEIGNVVYSLPNLESLELPESSTNNALTIVFSTDETDELVRMTCDVGDISEIRLLELKKDLDRSSQGKGQLPTVLEVGHFDQLVTLLLEEFRQKDYSKVKIAGLVQGLADFGEEASVATESWFPGGLAGWRRYITFLVQTAEMDGNDRARMAASILQGFWETVFDVLCNKVYFFTEIMDEKVKLSPSAFQERLALTKDVPQLAVLDLSQMRVFEPSDISILEDLKTKLNHHSVRLSLVSSGPNTRRQVNVLEASALFTRDLHIFPNAFNASFGTSN
ncbi:Hpt domain-containing protein [Desulfosporosinus hippei]|uniref:Hpt domain-containing protein n=1 Tax=Desulfosporosinus hippei DSM 8344 TaxID=1121419 RepID=A0A1G7WB31_9FIRM|nr:Hpt domain-containing protein [Desulfosporosinus hippei]SDG69186.1 Hpt domain-containing protein [Desulfosporosinus hippei DSM 8344]